MPSLTCEWIRQWPRRAIACPAVRLSSPVNGRFAPPYRPDNPQFAGNATDPREALGAVFDLSEHGLDTAVNLRKGSGATKSS